MKGLLPNSHYVAEIEILQLNIRLRQYTNGQVEILKKTSEHDVFNIKMGGYNVPSSKLIGDMLGVKVLDIRYEDTRCVRITYDRLAKQ